jgi:hypothetical protein
MDSKISGAAMAIYIILTIIFMCFFYDRHKKQYDSQLIKKDNTPTKMGLSLSSWLLFSCVMICIIPAGLMSSDENAALTGCSCLTVLILSGVSTFVY